MTAPITSGGGPVGVCSLADSDFLYDGNTFFTEIILGDFTVKRRIYRDIKKYPIYWHEYNFKILLMDL